jgi:tetratricopeptide (TPR) repeat protein
MSKSARKSKFPSLYFLGLIIIFCGACSTQKSTNEATRLELAQGLFYDQQFPQCIALADTVLNENKASLGAKNLKGLCLMGIGRYAEAEVLLAETVLKAPGPDAYNQLAAVQLKLNNFQKSEEYAQKALTYSTYSSPENAWSNIALARLQRKEYPGAQVAIEEALKLNDTSCEIRFLASRILQRRGLPELALRHADEGVTLCPMVDLAHFWRGYSLYKLGKRRDAFGAYRYLINQFKRGEIVEQSRVNLDLLQNRIPIPEPKL